MSLDKDTVARIARLARLKVPDDELAPLADELSGIFAWIEQLNEVDTKNVEPMSSVSDAPCSRPSRTLTACERSRSKRKSACVTWKS